MSVPSRETSEHKRSHRPAEESEDVATTSDTATQRDEMNAGIDDLLDEIDGVLEENAEDFVKSFVQKGGQ